MSVIDQITAAVVDNLDGTVTVNTWLYSIFPFPNGTTVLIQRRPITP